MEQRSTLLVRWLFLRGLAVVFAIAFVSIWVQVHGLVGSRGILPIGEFLDFVRERLGGPVPLRLPTLCWISASDRALDLQCGAGVSLSLALLVGFAPRLCLALLWGLYLSLAVAGQEFLSFQWDVLLLETAVFAIPYAPGTWRPGILRERPPSTVSVWLLRWLLFRLMFASGVVKLTSGDPCWCYGEFSALTFHYWSQPLPTVFAWYAHQLPLWAQQVSCVVMYAIEIGFPFLVFAGHRARQVAFAGLVLLQLLIALTGNYGFFNLLSILLCLPLLDDTPLARLFPRRFLERARLAAILPDSPGPPRSPRSGRSRRALRIAGASLAAIVVLFTGLEMLDRTRLLDLAGVESLPRPLVAAGDAIAPFRSLNDYGLVRVMTKRRLEIEIQGSDDGGSWKPYGFRWKPGPVDRAPGWVAPHMPRLDWQMWFAVFGPPRRSPWVERLLARILEGSPPVLALLGENPFPEKPPRFIRAMLHDYRFTTPEERTATGAWWSRADAGTFLSPRSLR
jgi:lipase maturation factor 1